MAKVTFTRKELKKPDRFADAVAKAVDWLQEYYVHVILALAAVLLTLGIGIVTSQRSERREMEANAKLANVLRQYADGAGKAELDEAVSKLESIAAAYDGSRASALARYWAGLYAFKAGNYDKAIEELRSFLADADKESTLYEAAVLHVGLAYFNMGRWDEAIRYLESISSRDSFFAKQARIHLGMAYEKIGRTDKATSIYTDLLEVM